MLGHDTGDLVLREVAHRLEHIVQQQHGFAVRLGGDEFIINMPAMKSSEDIRELAELVLSRLSTWDTQIEELHLSVSIGIVTYTSSESEDLKVLLKKADNALYRAKANGKNAYQYF
ncbi:Response regulator PleD [compost metagenome]